MTKDDFEKRLRTTPLIEPDPHWREEILANCSQRHSYWWVKVIGMAALLGIAGLSVHLWPHQKDVQNIHPIANHTSPSPERSIIPGFKLKSSRETLGSNPPQGIGGNSSTAVGQERSHRFPIRTSRDHGSICDGDAAARSRLARSTSNSAHEADK